MFEVARCFYKAAHSDFEEYRDGNFIIDNNRGIHPIIKIVKGHSGLILFEGKISNMESIMKYGTKSYVDFDINKIQNPIHEYTDEELVLILGRKYTDDYIFDAMNYNDIKKKIMLDKIKEFNSNV